MLKRALLCISLLIVTVVSWGLSIPDKPSNYVNDYAGMFSEATQQSLNQQLAHVDKETSNQIFVATFPSLDGESLEDFSIHLAEKWRAGSKRHDNGIILLFFKQDRKIRIDVGYGLESVIPDARALDIIQNVITPRFGQGNFDAGVRDGVNAIVSATQGTYQSTQKHYTDYAKNYIIVIGLFMFLLMRMRFRIFGMTLSAILGYFTLGMLGLFMFVGLVILIFLHRFHSTGTGLTLRSGNSPWRGGWGGGGFSGGGGGGFGGGGASGGW